MADALPEITLTDPNNRDTEPSPAFSPTVSAVPADLNGILKGAQTVHTGPGRPSTPSSKNRPDSSNGWTSPGRLIRTLSSNNANSPSGPSREDANGSKQDSQQAPPPPAMDPLSQVCGYTLCKLIGSFCADVGFLAYPQQNEHAVQSLAESTTYFTRECREWGRETFDRCDCCAGCSSTA